MTRLEAERFAEQVGAWTDWGRWWFRGEHGELMGPFDNVSQLAEAAYRVGFRLAKEVR